MTLFASHFFAPFSHDTDSFLESEQPAITHKAADIANKNDFLLPIRTSRITSLTCLIQNRTAQCREYRKRSRFIRFVKNKWFESFALCSECVCGGDAPYGAICFANTRLPPLRGNAPQRPGLQHHSATRLAKSARHRASSWPMITRGSLLIARGRKAGNLTFGSCLTSMDIAFAPDVGKYRLIACGLSLVVV
jgi:hypothetical protein